MIDFWKRMTMMTITMRTKRGEEEEKEKKKKKKIGMKYRRMFGPSHPSSVFVLAVLKLPGPDEK